MMRTLLVAALDPVLAHRVMRVADRTEAVDEVVAGRALGVAQGLRRLGEAVEVVCLGAGARAHRLEQLLAVDGIEVEFVEGGGRQVLAGVILHEPQAGHLPGSYHEMLPPAMPVQVADGEDLEGAIVSRLEDAAAVVVVATPRQAVEAQGWLARLQAAAADAAVPLVIDGPADWTASLDMTLPVIVRIAGFDGLAHAPELTELADGAGIVIVTADAEPVRVLSAQARFTVQPPEVSQRERSGAGAAFVAGLAAGLAEPHELPTAVRLGVAAAAADAGHWLPGSFDRTVVEGFLPQVGPALPL